MAFHLSSPRPMRSHAHHGSPHRVAQLILLALALLVPGFALYQAVYREADDRLLALLAPLVAFLALGSLFSGHDRRH